MRSRAMFAFVLSAAFAGAAIAQTQVTIVMSEWAPFEYTENGVFKGSDVEIMNAAFKEMGVGIKWEVYPWKRCEDMVKKNEADGLISLSWKADRETWLVYPKEPINVSENVIFVRSDSKLKFSKYEDLKGLTVGITAGYSYGPDFDQNTLFKREEAQTDELNFKKLSGKRMDGFVCDKVVGMDMVKKMGLQGQITYLPKTISELKMYAGFAKKPGAEALAAKFDKAMAAIKKNGTYQKILDKYVK